MKTTTTFIEFFNNHDVVELYVYGIGGTMTLTHDTETNCDEDYCNLSEILSEQFLDLYD